MRSGELWVLIPIIAIVCGMVTKLAQIGARATAEWRAAHGGQQSPARQAAQRELSGEEALFGLSAAEDLRDIRQRLDRLECQVSQVVQAVQAIVPAPAQATRSLDSFAEAPTPAMPPAVEQHL